MVSTPSSQGFTLVELSIVLVVIGLIMGGVLMGRDLIKAAEVRATIGQIEKYNTAANTFREKYGYLPGDIPDPAASSFGFQPRGTNPGQGDENGLIQSWNSNGLQGISTTGETGMFWVDLTSANLIPGTFNATSAANINLSSTNPALYLPAAFLGQGNYVNVWSGQSTGNTSPMANVNLFGISAVSTIAANGVLNNTNGLTVKQASAIDSKIDDGLPQSGRTQAMYVNAGCYWSTLYSSIVQCSSPYGVVPGYPGTSLTCMDNAGVSGGPMSYSVSQNSSNLNCALSVRMQAGD